MSRGGLVDRRRRPLDLASLATDSAWVRDPKVFQGGLQRRLKEPLLKERRIPAQRVGAQRWRDVVEVDRSGWTIWRWRKSCVGSTAPEVGRGSAIHRAPRLIVGNGVRPVASLKVEPARTPQGAAGKTAPTLQSRFIGRSLGRVPQRHFQEEDKTAPGEQMGL